MSAAIAIGGLAAAGTYLLLQRGQIRTVIGLVLLEHAINLLLATIRSPVGAAAAIAPWEGPVADPLAHAFTLTAIVIGLGTTVFLVALALRRTRDTPADGTREEAADGAVATDPEQAP